MKIKILVTGGAGYIGSHTILDLINTGKYEVVSIDNFSNSSPDTYERIKKISGLNVKHYNTDICDKKALRQVFEKEKNIEGIIHFAAYKSVPESVSDPIKYYSNNLTSLANILECCIEFSVSNLLFSSSCSVYGNISMLPVTEEVPLGETESPYAYTKQIGEKMILHFTHAHPSLKTIALRYFNPVGAHTSGLLGEYPINPPNNLVPVITQTAIGKIAMTTVFGNDYNTRDGSCIRDYVHVMDIASAHTLAMDQLTGKKGMLNFCIYNLGKGEGVSVLEAIHAFEKISGLKLNYTIGPRRPGDVEAIFSDTSKVFKELGWQAKFSLEEMMSTAWKWELHLKEEQK